MVKRFNKINFKNKISSEKSHVRDPAYNLSWEAANTLLFPVTKWRAGQPIQPIHRQRVWKDPVRPACWGLKQGKGWVPYMTTCHCNVHYNQHNLQSYERAVPGDSSPWAIINLEPPSLPSSRVSDLDFGAETTHPYCPTPPPTHTLLVS